MNLIEFSLDVSVTKLIFDDLADGLIPSLVWEKGLKVMHSHRLHYATGVVFGLTLALKRLSLQL